MSWFFNNDGEGDEDERCWGDTWRPPATEIDQAFYAVMGPLEKAWSDARDQRRIALGATLHAEATRVANHVCLAANMVGVDVKVCAWTSRVTVTPQRPDDYRDADYGQYVEVSFDPTRDRSTMNVVCYQWRRPPQTVMRLRDALADALLPLLRERDAQDAVAYAAYDAQCNALRAEWADRLAESGRQKAEAQRVHDEERAARFAAEKAEREAKIAQEKAERLALEAAKIQAKLDQQTIIAAQCAWSMLVLQQALEAAMPDAEIWYQVERVYTFGHEDRGSCDVGHLTLRASVYLRGIWDSHVEFIWYRDAEMASHCGRKVGRKWRTENERVSRATDAAADAWLAAMRSGQLVLPPYFPTDEEVQRARDAAAYEALLGQIAQARKDLAAQMQAASARVGDALPVWEARRYEAIMDEAVAAHASSKGSALPADLQALQRMAKRVAGL